MLLCFDELDEAAKNHVNGCSKEGGPEKKKESLDNVGTQRPVGRLMGVVGPGYVTDCLH